jgi:hypothetical protein
MMSKADDLRKKMANRGTAQAFTPRQSVDIQPLPQTQNNITEVKQELAVPRTKVPTTKSAVKPSKAKAQPETDELVALYAKVPKEDKRWLDHYRIDEGKDLGALVSEAINLLRKQAEKG